MSRRPLGGRPDAGRADAGAISLELVIIAPLLLGIVVLMLAYGRQAQVSGLVESAARDGARTATQARTYDEALSQVDEVVADTLSGGPASCSGSARVSLGSRAAFIPGAQVTVVVSCPLDFAEVGLPLPTRRLARSFTSTLDPYRGVR